MVQELKTLVEYEQSLKDNQRVAIDFTASWCGPCKFIGPEFEKMESDFPNIKFVKVDVDTNTDTAKKCAINAMPTFKFFKDGLEVCEDLVGANKDKLRTNLEKLDTA